MIERKCPACGLIISQFQLANSIFTTCPKCGITKLDDFEVIVVEDTEIHN